LFELLVHLAPLRHSSAALAVYIVDTGQSNHIALRTNRRDL
jgi:hypothetical protein